LKLDQILMAEIAQVVEEPLRLPSHQKASKAFDAFDHPDDAMNEEPGLPDMPMGEDTPPLPHGDEKDALAAAENMNGDHDHPDDAMNEEPGHDRWPRLVLLWLGGRRVRLSGQWHLVRLSAHSTF
jgi:hypothetical protein